MIRTYIQPGEAVIVHSPMSFDLRNEIVHTHAQTHPGLTVYAKEKILVDDVRDFAYEMQKYEVEKVGILICDDIAVSAQHALLKVLEDMPSNTCILIYTHVHSVFLSTVLSRVIIIHEKDTANSTNTYIVPKIHKLTVSERFAIVKDIVKKYEDEELSKQDIITIIESFQATDIKKDTHQDVYTRAISMLKQPSVSVKYVLEYVVSLV